MRHLVIALVGAVALGATVVLVEPLVGDAALVAQAEAKPAAKIAAPVQPAISPQHLYLIRSALSALQDANTTGNYSVLRDLAAPAFQARHSAADLAELFAQARRKPMDLAPAAYSTPVLTETARPDPARLTLAGFIQGQGEKITFTLQFEAVSGHWRIAGIALGAAP